jgi:uridine kinase
MSRPFLVAISGGSASGKSTVAAGLARRLGPERVTLLAQDAYYLDRGHLPAELRAALNYDVPEAFDRDLLVRHLRALRAGAAIEVPHYSFATHTRLPAWTPVAPRNIVVAEGLTLLADPELCGFFDLRLFIDAPDGLRYRRRLHRDTMERGRASESVRRQWELTVQPAHAAHVEPSRLAAEHVLVNDRLLDDCVETAAAHIAAGLRRRGLAMPEGATA